MNKYHSTRILFLNLLTVLLLALFIELALGYGLRHPGLIPDFLVTYYQNFYKSQDRSILQVSRCAEYDPEFFYRFKSGKCSFENREFNVVNEFNSAGLRDDEQSLNNPSIVIFGDSFTMGWGVPQSKPYPQVLESLCREKILNAGVSSFGTAREMKLLNKLSFKSPKTIIIQYHTNDYEENLTYIKNNYYLPINSSKTYDSIKENIDDRSRYYPFKYLIGISKSIGQAMLTGKKEQPSDTLEAEAFLRVVLHSGLNKIASRVFVFKIDNGVLNNGFVDAVDYCLKDPLFANLDITTVRINNVFDKEDYFILDEHLNARGHEKLAARLNDYLKVVGEPMVADQRPNGKAGKATATVDKDQKLMVKEEKTLPDR